MDRDKVIEKISKYFDVSVDYLKHLDEENLAAWIAEMKPPVVEKISSRVGGSFLKKVMPFPFVLMK